MKIFKTLTAGLVLSLSIGAASVMAMPNDGKCSISCSGDTPTATCTFNPEGKGCICECSK